jgi:hypothetical protein
MEPSIVFVPIKGLLSAILKVMRTFQVCMYVSFHIWVCGVCHQVGEMVHKQCLDPSDDGNAKIQQVLEAMSTDVMNMSALKDYT